MMCTTRREREIPRFARNDDLVELEKYINAARQLDGSDGEIDYVFYLHGFFLQEGFAVLYTD
jgi:hypothetical protein